MITIQASKEVGYHCGCGYHWKDNVNQWCHQTKMATCIESEGKICRNGKLWKTVWVIDVSARGSSTQTHLGEAGRNWLKGVHCQPVDMTMTDLVVRGGGAAGESPDGPTFIFCKCSEHVAHSIHHSLRKGHLWI